MNADAAEKPPILGYKHLSSARYDYHFECPVGVWTARLDMKAWGRNRSILLYWSELQTDAHYALAVYYPMHRPVQGGPHFRKEGQPGDIFQLETGKTRNGFTKLLAAENLSNTMF